MSGSGISWAICKSAPHCRLSGAARGEVPPNLCVANPQQEDKKYRATDIKKVHAVCHLCDFECHYLLTHWGSQTGHTGHNATSNCSQSAALFALIVWYCWLISASDGFPARSEFPKREILEFLEGKWDWQNTVAAGILICWQMSSRAEILALLHIRETRY